MHCSLLVVASSIAPNHIQLPPCDFLLAPSAISGTGFGVFAGRAFEQDVLVPVSWKTLFLPNNFPNNQVLYNYVFCHNETHMALVLDYGSVLNHHESANVEEVPVSNNVEFKATKDIAAGQEILVRYGSAQWFEGSSDNWSGWPTQLRRPGRHHTI